MPDYLNGDAGHTALPSGKRDTFKKRRNFLRASASLSAVMLMAYTMPGACPFHLVMFIGWFLQVGYANNSR
jgi:hypothetical protein